MPKRLFYTQKRKIQREVTEVVDLRNGTVVPLTKDAFCCFLSKDKKCAIYLRRPPICRIYGKRDDIPCPYFKKDGTPRTKTEIKIMKTQIDTAVDLQIEKLKELKNK